MVKGGVILLFILWAQGLSADPWSDYAEGLEASPSREKFLQAASTWESGGDQTPEALFNAGLSWLRADQPERALSPLRKYLALNPWDREAQELLRTARSWGELKDPGGLSFWFLDWKTWYLTALSLLSLPLLGWSAWRVYRNQKLHWLPLLLVLSAAPAFLNSPFPQAGQLKISVQGRRGDGEFYPPVQNTLWSAGQEVWIMEVRPSWSRVQVGNLSAWVPGDLIRNL